jgi:FtsZ-binding cell division protein ZapB
MTIDKEKLKALAEEATKLVVDWRVMKDRNNVNIVIGDGGWTIFSAWHTPDGKALANARFAAAANPNTILALLTEIENLDGCDKAYREVWEKARGLQGEMDEVIEERDQLKAENEALRKDAERYRWIEKQPTSWFALGEAFDLPSEHDGAPGLDASIDAAMAKEAK